MLTLNNVTISIQNCGSVIGVFLCSQEHEAIEQRYNSFYNWGAASEKGDLKWWTANCALFWVHSSGKLAEDKIINALTEAALSEILQSEKTKGANPWRRACLLARERYDNMERVQWYKPETGHEIEIHNIGRTSEHAKTNSGNFEDLLCSYLERPILTDFINSEDKKHIASEIHDNQALRLEVTDEAGASRLEEKRVDAEEAVSYS